MKKSLLWQVTKIGPQRVRDGKLKLEEHLEDWIVADPDLLQVGLTVIARQFVVEAGRIDLLALDPAGRLVVVEIKRGTLYRETVAQGLDYAECINSLPADKLVGRCDQYLKAAGKTLRGLLAERDALNQLEHGCREVLLYVVGTGKTERLERLAGGQMRVRVRGTVCPAATAGRDGFVQVGRVTGRAHGRACPRKRPSPDGIKWLSRRRSS